MHAYRYSVVMGTECVVRQAVLRACRADASRCHVPQWCLFRSPYPHSHRFSHRDVCTAPNHPSFAFCPAASDAGGWLVGCGSGSAGVCTDCPAGKFTSTAGAGMAWDTMCGECEPGRFQDAPGSFACLLCPGGYHQDLPRYYINSSCMHKEVRMHGCTHARTHERTHDWTEKTNPVDRPRRHALRPPRNAFT